MTSLPLEVRKSPSLNAPSVAFLEAGEIVEIAEMKQGYGRVIFNGLHGYTPISC